MKSTGRRTWWLVVLVVVLLGLAPLGAVAFLVEDRATEAVRREARTSLASSASLTALFVSEQLRGVEEVVVSYSRRVRLLEALTAPGGANQTELQRQLTELREARADVLNVAGVADLTGTMVGSTVPQPPGANFSDRKWFQSGVRTRAPYVSEALVGRSPGSPLAVSVAAPVLDSNRTLVGVIVVGYTLDKFQQFVETFAADQGMDVTVTDQAGMVIARPGVPPTTLESVVADRRVADALAGRTGTAATRQGARGTPVLSAYTPVPGAGWTVVAEMPRDRAYAGVDRLKANVRPIIAGLAVFVSLGGVLLARTLRSRDRARDRAERLASINSAVLEATREGMTLVDPAAHCCFTMPPRRRSPPTSAPGARPTSTRRWSTRPKPWPIPMASGPPRHCGPILTSN